MQVQVVDGIERRSMKHEFKFKWHRRVVTFLVIRHQLFEESFFPKLLHRLKHLHVFVGQRRDILKMTFWDHKQMEFRVGLDGVEARKRRRLG